jgi:hypothetical protein
MRKPVCLIFITAVFLMNTGNSAAADLKDGFFDIAWKTNLSQLEGFRKISEDLNVAYFVSDQRTYKIADIKISDVVYGSYENQFFAVYINIEAIDIFAQLRRYINRKYGLPKIKITKMQEADQQTDYQWSYEKTKIKLKIYENRDNMKLAFYYTPLSAQVNEAQMDAFQETHKKPIFPLDKTQVQQAEQLRDLMQF